MVARRGNLYTFSTKFYPKVSKGGGHQYVRRMTKSIDMFFVPVHTGNHCTGALQWPTS